MFQPFILRAFKDKQTDEEVIRQITLCTSRRMNTNRRRLFEELIETVNGLYEEYAAAGDLHDENVAHLREAVERVLDDRINSIMFDPDLDDAFVLRIAPMLGQLGLGVYLTDVEPDRPDTICSLALVGGPEALTMVRAKANRRERTEIT